MIKTLAAAAALVVAAGAAHAAATQSLNDWDAVCSNTGDCVATGFSPDDSDDLDAYLQVKLAAGPSATPKLVLTADPGAKQPSGQWTLSIDGHPVAGVGPVSATGSDGGAQAQIAGPAALALIDALKNGKSLEINAAGKALAKISLAGSAAILLWVDDQQGRVGTVTALVRKGPKPASAVPPAVPMPLIAAAPAVSQAGLPKSAPKSLIKGVEDCNLDPSVTPDDIVARLAPGVVLWGPECQMAAYNEVNIFFLGDEKAGHLKRIVFPEPQGESQPTTDELINASFDPKTQILSTFNKGRGIADCGDVTSWVWTGKAFAVHSELDMPDCRGVSSDDWPTLFESRSR
jgi:hypothetical protein